MKLSAHARKLLILSQNNTITMRAQRVRKPTAKAFIQKQDTLSTVSEAHKALVFSTESSNAKITQVCVSMEYSLAVRKI
jgi:hypothetical protein